MTNQFGAVVRRNRVAFGLALALWQRELTHGKRTRTTFDDLWRAACLELTAQEHQSDGLPGVARTYAQMGRDIIARAAVRAAG